MKFRNIEKMVIFAIKLALWGFLRMLNSFMSSDFIFHPSTRGCKIRVGGEISKYRENGDFCNKTGCMGNKRCLAIKFV